MVFLQLVNKYSTSTNLAPKKMVGSIRYVGATKGSLLSLKCTLDMGRLRLQTRSLHSILVQLIFHCVNRRSKTFKSRQNYTIHSLSVYQFANHVFNVEKLHWTSFVATVCYIIRSLH